MLHSVSGALPTGPANPLGLVDFEELGDLLRVSRPTLERLIRKDHTFPRLFRIGGKRYARASTTCASGLSNWRARRDARSLQGDGFGRADMP
jgi:predicted DNA-binding transcriptional regulator AlpA